MNSSDSPLSAKPADLFFSSTGGQSLLKYDVLNEKVSSEHFHYITITHNTHGKFEFELIVTLQNVNRVPTFPD